MLVDSGLHADAPWKSMNIYQISLFAGASCRYSSEGGVRGRERSPRPDIDQTRLAKHRQLRSEVTSQSARADFPSEPRRYQRILWSNKSSRHVGRKPALFQPHPGIAAALQSAITRYRALTQDKVMENRARLRGRECGGRRWLMRVTMWRVQRQTRHPRRSILLIAKLGKREATESSGGNGCGCQDDALSNVCCCCLFVYFKRAAAKLIFQLLDDDS